MARKQLLDGTTANQLKMRVKVSRETQIFSLEEVAEGWGISKATMYRYESEIYRDASRERARKQYRRRRPSRTHCEDCHALIKGHRRCADCEILIHAEEMWCNSCIATRLRDSIKPILDF